MLSECTNKGPSSSEYVCTFFKFEMNAIESDEGNEHTSFLFSFSKQKTKILREIPALSIDSLLGGRSLLISLENK